jgi:APA family basic amino acid/polyamine antiporter
MGISRLAFNLSSHHQLPELLSHTHHRFRTPYIAIVLFCIVALVLLVPGFFSPSFFKDLGALYVFGSLLCFALAHAAILALRIRKPALTRPFKLGLNLKIKGRELPLTAILGLLATSAIWFVIMIIQPYSRWAGLLWMVAGFAIYYFYRRIKGMPLGHFEEKLPAPDTPKRPQ